MEIGKWGSEIQRHEVPLSDCICITLMKAGTSASTIKKISSEISEKKNVADLRWLLAKFEERL